MFDFLSFSILVLQLWCSGHAGYDIMVSLGCSEIVLSLRGAVTSVSCLHPLCQPEYSHGSTEEDQETAVIQN